MYYLYIITLEDCPYSIAAIDLLKSLKIKYKRLKVNQKNKEKYKTQEIDTFPQIYIVKDKKKLLLGGYSNLKEFTDIFIINVVLRKRIARLSTHTFFNNN